MQAGVVATRSTSAIPRSPGQVNRLAVSFIAQSVVVAVVLWGHLLTTTGPLVPSSVPWWSFLPLVAVLSLQGVSRARGGNDSSSQDNVGLVAPAMLLLCAPWQLLTVVLIADDWAPSPRQAPVKWLFNTTSHLASCGIMMTVLRLVVHGHDALGVRGVLALILASVCGQVWESLHLYRLLHKLVGDRGGWREDLSWQSREQIVQTLTIVVTVVTMTAVHVDHVLALTVPALFATLCYVRMLAGNATQARAEVGATHLWLSAIRVPTCLDNLDGLATTLACALRATSVTISLDGARATSAPMPPGLSAERRIAASVASGAPVFGKNRCWADLRARDSLQLSVLPLEVIGPDSYLAVSYRSSGLNRVPAMRPDSLERAGWEICRAVERQRSRLQLQRAARYDVLTGLLYPSVFLSALDAHLATWTSSTVLLLDVGQLREVNDLFGREAGDEVLRTLASSLAAALSENALTGRLGGHLLAAAFADDDADRAISVAKLLLRVLERSVAHRYGRNLTLTMGLAYSADHSTGAEMMVRRAELGLDDARRRGLPFGAFTWEAERLALRRLKLVPDLRAALRGSLIQAHYQPQVSPLDGSIVGMEALARWTHHELGAIPPDEFVQLAESSGLVQVLTTTMLRQALRQCRSWCEEGLGVPISVNISARNLADPSFPELVATVLEETGVPAVRLVLEITETAVMEDRVACIGALTRLRCLGVAISIDDFGTGQSSLAYLRELPADEVKLDRAFTRDLDDDRALALVQASVSLAHSLGLRIVAEGVENEATLATLRDLGVDVAQGYHVCRPGPPEVITQFLTERTRATVAA